MNATYAPLLFLMIAPACGGAWDTSTIRIAQEDPGGPTEPSAHHFPLEAGITRFYEGVIDGQFWQEEVFVLPERRLIGDVECTGVHEIITVGNQLREFTTEWFAADSAGDVWKYGEETVEPAPGGVIMVEAWFADEPGAYPWRAFSAAPQAGHRYSGFHGDDKDDIIILSTTAVATTPAGTFENCLQLEENPDDPEDRDIILYGPGRGRVVEESKGGRIVLVREQRTTPK